MTGLDAKSLDHAHRLLLIDAVGFIQGEEHLVQSGNRTKDMPRNIGNVVFVHRFLRQQQRERGFKPEIAGDRVFDGFGVGGRFRFERCDPPRRVGQDLADGDFPHVHDIEVRVRMARLVMGRDFALQTFVDHPGHPVNVAENKVHVIPLHDQPAAAVHPRSPLPRRENQIFPVLVIPFRRDFADALKIKARGFILVNADIDIGSLVMCAPGSGPAQHNPRDAGYALQLLADLLDQLLYGHDAINSDPDFHLWNLRRSADDLGCWFHRESLVINNEHIGLSGASALHI